MHFKANKIKTLKSSKILTAVLLLLLISAPVFAATESEIRDSLSQLKSKVSSGQSHLGHLQNTTQTLEQKLSTLEQEIRALEAQINSTNQQIAATEQELKEKEAELNRQKEIMASSIKLLYKRGRVSTVELIASSEDFGDYVDQEEYVQRIKVQVHEASKEVAALKAQLEQKKAQLEELLATQTGQKLLIDQKKAEQQELVNKARAEEFSYKQYVSDLQKQEQQAEAALASFLRSRNKGNFVSYGRVSQGDIVGYTGSTGNSSGNHLHLGLWNDGSDEYVDPLVSGSHNLKYGFSWPYSGDWPISRGYDCTMYPTISSRPWCPGANKWFHEGVDIAAPGGTPVRAIGDGDIIYRDTWYGGGYTVMIKHGNGFTSQYLHMQPF